MNQHPSRSFFGSLLGTSAAFGLLMVSGGCGDVVVDPPVAPADPTPTNIPAVGPSPTVAIPVVCTQVYIYGVTVEVQNPQGEPIDNATLVLTDGTYTEQMKLADPPEDGIYQGAGERAGTYDLNVSAPGYQPQTIEDLTVTADECHVDPLQRTVILQP